jgi:anti-sigma factor RsiW
VSSHELSARIDSAAERVQSENTEDADAADAADAALVAEAVAIIRTRRLQDYHDASPPLAETATLRREIRTEVVKAKLRRGDTLTRREISILLRRLCR